MNEIPPRFDFENVNFIPLAVGFQSFRYIADFELRGGRLNPPRPTAITKNEMMRIRPPPYFYKKIFGDLRPGNTMIMGWETYSNLAAKRHRDDLGF